MRTFMILIVITIPLLWGCTNSVSKKTGNDAEVSTAEETGEEPFYENVSDGETELGETLYEDETTESEEENTDTPTYEEEEAIPETEETVDLDETVPDITPPDEDGPAEEPEIAPDEDDEAPPAPVCGNGIVENGEKCDSDEKECYLISPDFVSGTAICKRDCSGYDTSECATCQNGKKDPGETCDPTAYPYTVNCASKDIRYIPEQVTCKDDCSGYHYEECDYYPILITEIYGTYSLKYVEIYNNSDKEFSMDGLSLRLFPNGDSSHPRVLNFTSSHVVPAHGTLVIANNADLFRQKFGFSPDLTSGAIEGDGDDQYLIQNQNSIAIEIYGELFGNDTSWYYQNKVVKRRENVNLLSPQYDPMEWEILSVDEANPGNRD